MTTRQESKPATVPFAANPAGEPPPARAWANRWVWTERMLATLESGQVRGGRWHTLIDKVYNQRNLQSALFRVAGNRGAAGVDHQSVQAFIDHGPEELARLAEALRSDAYRPQAVRRILIPKPGSKERRPLGIPTVRDRVVQAALLAVLEPIFDETFADHSYGFRRGRGCHHALEHVEALLEAGYVYVVDADLQRYFDTIPHDGLMARIAGKVSDSRVLRLTQMFLQQDVMHDLQAWTPEAGTPQGAVISPLLANIYLDPLDHLVSAAGLQMVRYADDFLILCRTPEDAARGLELVTRWVAENGLTLHPTKTKIVDARTVGLDFLGYHFRGRLRLPRIKSLQKFKDTIRAQTRRVQGDSLPVICARLRPVIQGWFAYFCHCHYAVYRDLDGWVRMRLRSLLRKRVGRSGPGRGRDHQRWPNSYFAEHGLYSLTTAHAQFANPP